ncbi:MAG: lysophospholipid acyltransferase family protein [Lentisphaeria bacterium]
MRTVFTFKNKRHMPKFFAWCAALILKLIRMTFRVKIIDPHHYRTTDTPFIGALWHNRLLFAPSLGGRSFCRRISVLISSSRDGEYIATIIKFFNIEPVRGSSSRGGLKALLDLLKELKKRRSTIITVDGPRGPRYVLHQGIAMLAYKSGLPVVPIMINSPNHWTLKSWDRMQIPKPFSKIYFILGDPIVWHPDDTMDGFTEKIRTALLAITKYDQMEPEKHV